MVEDSPPGKVVPVDFFEGTTEQLHMSPMRFCGASGKQKEVELNTALQACAKELTKMSGDFKARHQRISGEVGNKLGDLKARGIATDIPGLESLLRQKTAVAKEIAAVEQRAVELSQTREERVGLRAELK